MTDHQTARRLAALDQVLILTHRRPDGDTIGCAAGLCAALREQGKTILISSHVLSELSELCTDIGIIDQGKMVLSGSMEAILRRVNTSNPLIISILGSKEKALTILKSQPCVQTISVKEGNIMVQFVGDEEDEAVLLQQLVDAEVMVHGFTREPGSLESLFMQITDHDVEKAVLVHENESGI